MTETQDRGADAEQRRPARARAAGRRSRRGCPWCARSRRRARRRRQGRRRRAARSARGRGALGRPTRRLGVPRPPRRRWWVRSARTGRRWWCSRRRRPSRRRPGSSDSAPPTKRPPPARPSEMPSRSPSAAAGAPRVVVTKLGIRAVGISWPTSARKLAVPMPPTPGVSHGRREDAVAVGGPAGASESLTRGRRPQIAAHVQTVSAVLCRV